MLFGPKLENKRTYSSSNIVKADKNNSDKKFEKKRIVKIQTILTIITTVKTIIINNKEKLLLIKQELFLFIITKFID